MFIVDLHCDSLSTVSSEQGLINSYNFSKTDPQLQFTAAFVPRKNQPPEQRRHRLMRFMDIYIAEYTRLGLVNVTGCHDLAFAQAVEKRATMFTVEGGGGLFADSEELKTLHRMGMRVMGLAWDGTELSASAFDEDDYGLTEAGRDMIDRCSELGIIIDVSHMSDKALADALKATAYPVIATHSNLREITDSKRNLPIDMAKRIASRGGIIGLNLYPRFLSCADKAGAEDIYRHTDAFINRLGEDCLALGLDIDGTDGSYPEGINPQRSIHDQLAELLTSRYGDRITEKIMGENAVNFLKSNL